MAELRRLVNLPGYDDTARDIYETPDASIAADDTSTTLTQRTSPRSASPSSHTSDDDDDEEEQTHGISRRRLFPERARSRFSGVQTAGNVDLSDRVDGRRRGYRVRRGESRGQEDGGGGEEEGLEARIARLRREIEECKAEAESELDFGGRDEMVVGDLEGLGRVLAGLEVGKRRAGRKAARAVEGRDASGGASVTPGSWPDAEGGDEEQLLGRVVGFDSRLAALEQALGLSALDSAILDGATIPVLPSLAVLDQQLATLSSAASLTNLETASARIQKLRADAERWSQSGSQAQAQSTSRPNTRGGAEDQASPIPSLGPEDMTKLQALYQLLPTLQSLAPTVPALLDRLRSLRTLHTNAASAAGELDEVERRQREMDEELKAWREGLEKVEAAVAHASEANGTNGKVVEKWVRDLEGRVKQFGR